MKTNIYNKEAKPVKEIELAAKVFEVKTSEALVHQAVVAQLANARQTLAHTKDRSEVAGTGKKPWRQKGTGRARAGSRRSPIWVGGGITFGPTKDRNFKVKINDKMRKKALAMALSDRAAGGQMAVIDELAMSEFKTKDFVTVIKAFEANVWKLAPRAKRSILIVKEAKDPMVRNSGRNIAGVEVIYSDNINIVDILKYKYLIMTEEAVNKLQK